MQAAAQTSVGVREVQPVRCVGTFSSGLHALVAPYRSQSRSWSRPRFCFGRGRCATGSEFYLSTVRAMPEEGSIGAVIDSTFYRSGAKSTTSRSGASRLLPESAGESIALKAAAAECIGRSAQTGVVKIWRRCLVWSQDSVEN